MTIKELIPFKCFAKRHKYDENTYRQIKIKTNITASYTPDRKFLIFFLKIECF